MYEQEARPELAALEFEKAIQLSGGFNGLAALGHLYAVAGRHADLQRVLGQIDAQRKQRYLAPFDLAVIHAGMRENAKALADLEQAYTDRSLSAQSLRFDPRLNRVRMEPGYRQFVKRIGLE